MVFCFLILKVIIQKKQINDKRCVIMKSFTGKTGQEEYQLTLLFGSKSLSRCARDLRIEEYVPDPEDSDWLEVDTVKKKRTVRLA